MPDYYEDHAEALRFEQPGRRRDAGKIRSRLDTAGVHQLLQIYNHGSGRVKEGEAATWPVSDVPAAVVVTALKAANLIGGGLYGVDLKQTATGVVVIEVSVRDLVMEIC